MALILNDIYIIRYNYNYKFVYFKLKIPLLLLLLCGMKIITYKYKFKSKMNMFAVFQPFNISYILYVYLKNYIRYPNFYLMGSLDTFSITC